MKFFLFYYYYYCCCRVGYVFFNFETIEAEKDFQKKIVKHQKRSKKKNNNSSHLYTLITRKLIVN